MKHTSNTFVRQLQRHTNRLALITLATTVCVFGSSTATVLAASCPVSLSKLDCDSLYGGWEHWVPDSCPTDSVDPAEAYIPPTDISLYTKYPHIKTAFQFFMEHDLSPAQSAGIVGNLMQESSEAIDPMNTDGVAHGIAQWQGGRLQPMYAWVTAWAAANKDPAGKNSFMGQLNYIMYDIGHERANIRNSINGMDSPEEVAEYWNRHYEISGDYTDKRQVKARGVYTTAIAQKWTKVVKADDLDAAATGEGESCISSIVGTVVGTTCYDIGKKSLAPNAPKDPNHIIWGKENPYVCVNSEVICPVGTDRGVGRGYNNGKEYDIRLCRVHGLTVNAFVAKSVDAMITAAAAENIKLTGGSFRTLQDQIDTRKANCGSSHYDIYEKPASQCRPPAAEPKYSNHQMGMAVDWSACTGAKCSASLIDSHGDAGFKWLNAHANNSYHFYNLDSEPWHWSVDGR